MKRNSTSEKILETGRELFNVKGYSATSLSDIAQQIGISKGNLTYHFATKQVLALELRDRTRQKLIERREDFVSGVVEEDYVEHLLFAMDLTWNNRFLFKGNDELAGLIDGRDSELLADFEELLGLMKRIKQAGMFRKGEGEDLETLTRSIWIVSRYWMDYLREVESKKEITWKDPERGIQHHLAILLPCLTAAGKRKFAAAVETITQSA